MVAKLEGGSAERMEVLTVAYLASMLAGERADSKASSKAEHWVFGMAVSWAVSWELTVAEKAFRWADSSEMKSEYWLGGAMEGLRVKM